MSSHRDEEAIELLGDGGALGEAYRKESKARRHVTPRRLLMGVLFLAAIFIFFGRGGKGRKKPSRPPIVERTAFSPHAYRGRPPDTYRAPGDTEVDIRISRAPLSEIWRDADALVEDPEHAPVSCSISAEHRLRFVPLLATRENILVVASYSNSENVLLTAIRELPALASFLGPQRVHVAITEGGSTDHTPDLLYQMGRALTSVGASFSILSDGNTKKSAWDQPEERIKILAEARNWPLRHLEGGVAEVMDGFDAVLIMNDITFCAVDALELLYQRLVQDADAVCALDYNRWLWVDSRPLAFYDSWVARTIEGKCFWDVQSSGNFYNGDLDFEHGLLVNSPASKARYEALQPFQVFSCWNGMLTVRAQPLLPPHNIRLRPLTTQQVSESYVFSQDLWMAGFGRIAVAPRARVGYSKENYDLAGMVNRTHGISRRETIESEGITHWQEQPPALVEYYDEHSFWTPAMRPWNWLPKGVAYR